MLPGYIKCPQPNTHISSFFVCFLFTKYARYILFCIRNSFFQYLHSTFRRHLFRKCSSFCFVEFCRCPRVSLVPDKGRQWDNYQGLVARENLGIPSPLLISSHRHQHHIYKKTLGETAFIYLIHTRGTDRPGLL